MVASYNIHSCVGTDGRFDPGRVADVLTELNADIIALQEVDAQHRLGDYLDQWTFLAQAAGYHCIPGISLRTQRRNYGNALLTRRPVHQVRLHDLSIEAHEPRGAIDADIVVGQDLLRVVATHFGLRRGERRRQAEILGNLLAESATDQVPSGVLLGDLNEWLPISRSLRPLLHLFHRSHAPRTFPARRPLLALDRILAAGTAHLSDVAAHGSRLARLASDHLPVSASLSWLPVAE